MLTSAETIKLFLTLNKLIFKHAEVGRVIYTKRKNPDVDSEEFLELLELAMIIDMLLETSDSIVKGGLPYPNYVNLEGNELEQFLDYVVYTYELDPVPFLDFPRNTTNYVLDASGTPISESGGTTLPPGGGPGFFLTKNISGNLIWEEIAELFSDFNLI